MSLRAQMLAAFAAPIAMLLFAVVLVLVQRGAVQQVIRAVDARDAIHHADGLIADLQELARSGSAERVASEAPVYRESLSTALAQMDARLSLLPDVPVPESSTELRARVDASLASVAAHPGELECLLLEESLAELSERVGMLSVEVKNRQIVALEAERDLGNLPIRFGAPLAALALGLAALAAWRSARRFASPIAEIAAAADRVSNGELDIEIASPDSPELDRLADAFRKMIEGLSRLHRGIDHARAELETSTGAIRGIVHAASEGAGAQAAEVGRASENIASIADSIGSIADDAAHLVSDARAAADAMTSMDAAIATSTAGAVQLDQEVEGVASSIVELQASALSIDDQAQALEAAASATHQASARIEDSVGRIDAAASGLASSAQETREAADSGRAVMNGAIDEMRAVERAFQAIDESASELSVAGTATTDILSSIQDVADRTQLVSLNASIIAAQAGSQGRAFAVVANEVASLAELASKSVGEASERLHAITDGVATSVQAAEVGASQVQRASDAVREASRHLADVTTQARGAEQQNEEIRRLVSEARSEVAGVVSEAHRTAEAAEQVGRATTEQGRTGRAMLESAERIRGIASDARSRAENQRAESERLSALSATVRERSVQIGEQSTRQRERAEEIRASLEVFRSAASDWESHTAPLEEAIQELVAGSDALRDEVQRFRSATERDEAS